MPFNFYVLLLPYSYLVKLIFDSPVRYQFLRERSLLASLHHTYDRVNRNSLPSSYREKKCYVPSIVSFFNNVLIKEFRFERDLNSIKSFRLSYYTLVWRISFIKWLLEKQFISHFFAWFGIWSGVSSAM